MIKQHFYVFRWIASDLCRHLCRRMVGAIFLEQDGLLMIPTPYHPNQSSPNELDDSSLTVPLPSVDLTQTSQLTPLFPTFDPQSPAPPDYMILQNQLSNNNSDLAMSRQYLYPKIPKSMEAIQLQTITTPSRRHPQAAYQNPSFNYTP